MHDLPPALLLSYSVAALGVVWPLLALLVAFPVTLIAEGKRYSGEDGVFFVQALALVYGALGFACLFCLFAANFWNGYRDVVIYGLGAECGDSLAAIGRLPCGNATALAGASVCSTETQAVVDLAYSSCGDLFELYFASGHWNPFHEGFWQGWNENACAEPDGEWDQCSPDSLLDFPLPGFVYERELDFEQNFANATALIASIVGSCGCGASALELPPSFATEQVTEK